MGENRGNTHYSWKYTGEEASQYKAKYTQGFDPQYLQHAAERKQLEEQQSRTQTGGSRRSGQHTAGRRTGTHRADGEREGRYQTTGEHAGRRQTGRQPAGEETRRRPSQNRHARLTRQQQIVTRVDDTPLEEQINNLAIDQEIYAEEKPARQAAYNRRRSRRAALRRRRNRIRAALLAVVGVIALFIILLIANRHELTITMAGSDPLYVEYGEIFTDPGATAEYKGTIFHLRDREVAVTSLNDVDTSRYGTYQIKYHAAYKDQETEVTRTVIIRDTTAPTIELNASANVVMSGETWKDAYTASDDQDGDVTAKVEVTGAVDTTRSGTYELQYRVVDAAGNAATATREVIVTNYLINNPGLAKPDGSNVVYLTFDDGPGPYTEELLEILNQFNVKATFFATNQWPEYAALLKEEAEHGHAIGNHTASHDYGWIYSNTDAFWQDYEEMDQIIEEHTGKKPTIFRFPGGSSNTASDDHTIMTNLTKQSAERGLTYYDWTIISGDSSPGYTEESIYNAIVYTLEAEEKPDCLMVLCHDLIEETVTAMREVIPWCLEHGYVFLPITEDTPVIHHSVQY